MEFDRPCLEWIPYMPGTISRSIWRWTRTYRSEPGLIVCSNRSRVSQIP